MRIGQINSYQSFKGKNYDLESFMGSVSDVFDTTSKASENISDIVGSAKNAFTTPGEATIGILTGQIEDKVVNNKKAPGWLRKTATYGAATLAAGGAIIGARKAPGFIKSFIVKNLSKFNAGKKLLEKAVTVKQSVSKFIDTMGREKIKSAVSNFGKYFSEKFPKASENLSKFSHKVKLDTLTKLTLADYVKNIFAITVGYQTGKKVLDRNQNKIEDKKEQIPEKLIESEAEYSEAA